MANGSARTTQVLVGLLVCFIFIIIIICVVPSHNPGSAAPKSSPFDGKDVIIEKDKTTTTTTTTSTTTTTTTTTTPSTTTTITTSSTKKPEDTVPEGDEETTTKQPDTTTTQEIETQPHSTKETTTTMEPPTTIMLVTDATTEAPDNTTTQEEEEIQPETTTTQGTEETQPGTTTTQKIETTEAPDNTTTQEEEEQPGTTTTQKIETTEAPGTTTTQMEEEEQPETTTTQMEEEEQPTTTTTQKEEEEQPETTTTQMEEEEQPTTTTQSTWHMEIEEGGDNVCMTESCKKLAIDMMMMRDNTTDACEDFYQYACGGILDHLFRSPVDPKILTNKIIREKLLRTEANDPVFGRMKTFYDTCRNTDFDAAVKDQIKGFFANVGYEFTDAIDENFDFPKMLGTMMKYGFTPFFDIRVDVKSYDKDSFIYKITPPLDHSYLLSDPVPKAYCLRRERESLQEAWLQYKDFDINSAYENYKQCLKEDGLQEMLDTAAEAVKTLGLSEDENFIASVRGDTFEFYQSVLETLPDQSTIQADLLKKKYAKKKLTEVWNNEEAWYQVLSQLQEHPEQNPDTSQKAEVYFVTNLTNTFQLLQKEMSDQNKNLQNIMLFLWTEFLYTNFISHVDKGSEDYCYHTATTLMPDLTSLLYLDHLPHLEEKNERIKEMIEKSKIAATVMMKRRNNSETEAMEKKLELLEGEVVRREEFQEVIQEPQPSSLDPNKFISSSIELIKNNRQVMYSIKEDFETSEKKKNLWRDWHFLVHPHSTQGVASYPLNKFFIPPGAMQDPLYHEDVPQYIEYAGIGHMIAHELIHAFDPIGLEYDGGIGRLNDEGGAAIEYPPDLSNSKTCLAQEMQTKQNHTTKTNITMLFQVNGDLKLNEHLADSGAIRVAWEAYLQELNPSEIEKENTIVPTGPRPTRQPQRRRRREALRLRRAKRSNPESSSFPAAPETPNTYLPTTDTTEPKLPYIDLEPIQLYFLHFAQTQCSASSELDMLSVMEGAYLPAHMRVNHIMQNEPLFAKAFNCKDGSMMKKDNPCPYLL